MRLLLDTHAFLWGYADPKKLGRKAGLAMGDPKNEVFLSAASAWEMALKSAKGNLTLPQTLGTMLEALDGRGLGHLPVTWQHTVKLQALPSHHRDPFHRILVAQALVEGLTLVSADKAFKKYDVPLLW